MIFLHYPQPLEMRHGDYFHLLQNELKRQFICSRGTTKGHGAHRISGKTGSLVPNKMAYANFVL